ncbi:MAG: YbaN family protein [Saprospiraceae bacterium]|nr:YbaN family protein [Saprospiraceae bacterium]
MDERKPRKVNIFWLSLGIISLILGVIGIFLPILPTTPFLLLTAYCFARGSDKFHKWFTSTALYKKYIENYVFERAMHLTQKIQIFLTVLSVTALGLYFIESLPVRMILITVILIQIIYLTFFVRTKSKSEK